MEEITVGVFSPSAPMIVARSLGYFRDRGLEVIYEQVTSSAQQFRDFTDGRYQLIQTAFDNVANYRLNNRSNALHEALPVGAVIALDGGMDLTLVAKHSISASGGLRGATVSVDAVDTGYAFVLFHLLRAAGLERGADYAVVSHGGVLSRYQALLDGKADATLLSNGLEVLGVERGLNRIARLADSVEAYLGSVLAGLTPWLEAHADIRRRFVDAYEEALAYSVDPAHADAVVDAVAESRRMPRATAAKLLAAELLPRVGVSRETTIDRAAARAVLELRDANHGFDLPPDIDALASPATSVLIA